jgi:hypothetical protein
MRQLDDWPNVYLANGDTFLATVKNPAFAEEYLETLPSDARGLLEKYGYVL